MIAARSETQRADSHARDHQVSVHLVGKLRPTVTVTVTGEVVEDRTTDAEAEAAESDVAENDAPATEATEDVAEEAAE